VDERLALHELRSCGRSMYMIGEGVRQDDQEAVKWFRRAAEQGDAHAQFRLGEHYDSGRGVPQVGG
jgi:TPR repeat protein